MTYPSLTNGKYITDMSVEFTKDTTTSYTAYINMYVTTNGNLGPGQLSSMTSIGSYSFSGVNGSKTMTLSRSAINVIQGFLGTWYLVWQSDSSVTTRLSGNVWVSGNYYDTSAWVKVGGVWKRADPQVRVGGIYKSSTAYVKVGGVWKMCI